MSRKLKIGWRKTFSGRQGVWRLNRLFVRKVWLETHLCHECKQHTTEKANHFRCVTKIRWVVESTNGRIKTWKALDQVDSSTQIT